VSLRPRSFRVRLTLWYATALALVLAAFSGAVYAIVRASLLHEVEERAEQNLAVIQRLVIDDPLGADEIEEHGIVTHYAIVREGGDDYISTAWKEQALPELASLGPEPAFRRVRSASGDHFALASATSVIADRRTTIFAAADEESVLAHLRTLALVLLVGFPIGIAIAIAGSWFLASRMLAPVARMADAAGRITADRLADRLPIEDSHDELGRLAAAFNQTLERLQDAFERLRRFTADASHELRTPLTALRSVGEVALRNPASIERSRETIVSMLEESQRLTQLVEGLLMLTRESTDAYRARFVPVDMGEVAQEVVELFRPLSEEKRQRIDAVGEPTSPVLGDRTTLKQAVLNLVDNAIKYTPPGGSIRVHTHDGTEHDVFVDVSDDGPGIAAEHHEKVFERFYRVDGARARSTGGVGLGLAIARWAVELNGGRIELESRLGHGSTFRAVFPPASNATSGGAASTPSTLVHSGGPS
jgi:heavy metal sensor kinase